MTVELSVILLFKPKNEPITIYGDGSQTRSFCYVDDLIDGFINLWVTMWTKQDPSI